MNPSSSVLEDLFKQIIGPLTATQIVTLMIEPDNIEERVQLLEKTFNDFPHLILPFKTLIKGLNPQDTEVPFEEQIRFFTTKHTRNWLIVNLMNQVLNLKELKLDETTGRLPGKPHDLIKYAVKAQQAFGEDSRYKDLVFSAGLMFDFLIYLQKTPHVNVGQTRLDESIDQCFLKALEQGKLITQLSKYKSKLTLETICPVTAFMRQLSQASLYLLRSDTAVEFYKELAKVPHTESYRLALEMKTFSAHTGMISAYLAQAVPGFGQLGEAMSTWGAPFLSWVSGKREVHDLSGMGLLGVSVNERVKGPRFTGQGLVGDVIPELKNLDFNMTEQVKREVKA